MAPHPDALGSDRSIVEIICMSPLVVFVVHCIVSFRDCVVDIQSVHRFSAAYRLHSHPPFSYHPAENA